MLSIILAGLLQWNVQNKNLEKGEENGKFTTYISGSNNPRITRFRTFTLGESVSQTEEKVAREREVASQKLLQRGESYTGTGKEVEIVSKDTEYFNCVKYSKAKSGISASIGNGGRNGINSNIPQIGAIGVEKTRYHAVYIEAIDGDKIVISEANYYKGWITRRVLSRSDFIGYIV
jgi:hypothetical protein